MKSFKKTLFIFRRDLRLNDNTGLIKSLNQSKEVIPCFIFEDAQIESHPYLSVPGFRFMIDSLKDLDSQLRDYGSCLSLFRGVSFEIIKELIETQGIDCVCVNRDYTPFSLKRDEKTAEICRQRGVSFESCSDLLLNDPEKTLKKDGKPYTVFTPYFRNAFRFQIEEPEQIPENRFSTILKNQDSGLEKIFSEILEHSSPLPDIKGGRRSCLNILNKLRSFSEYETQRDFPYLDMTTGLSAHLKFGTCSVREIYHTIKNILGSELLDTGYPLVRQLYWRDFFTHIAFFFPHIFGNPFHRKYDSIIWKNNAADFQAWCQGKTGFPIVDAGMRQLNETGFMHGRARMICASFLVKDLHVDWRWGEKYFASRLTDYDPAVNNGNWQWAASTGCDSQPYFRIFNPWIQQKKYDTECIYIKKWVPELKELPAKAIHGMEKRDISGYPGRITNHRTASEQAKWLFSNHIDLL